MVSILKWLVATMWVAIIFGLSLAGITQADTFTPQNSKTNIYVITDYVDNFNVMVKDYDSILDVDTVTVTVYSINSNCVLTWDNFKQYSLTKTYAMVQADLRSACNLPYDNYLVGITTDDGNEIVSTQVVTS